MQDIWAFKTAAKIEKLKSAQRETKSEPEQIHTHTECELEHDLEIAKVPQRSMQLTNK